jgi:hypothetical protein
MKKLRQFFFPKRDDFTLTPSELATVLGYQQRMQRGKDPQIESEASKAVDMTAASRSRKYSDD